MSEYGDGPELVIGSFNTIRVFGVIEVDGEFFLNPVAVRAKPYRNSDWYIADCAVRYDFINFNFRGQIIIPDFCRDVVWIKKPRPLYNPYDYFPNTYFATDSNDVWDQIPIERAAAAPEHGSPNQSCNCGFYSFYSLLKLRNELYLKSGVLGHHPSKNSLLVVAVVENAGRVLHGTNGIRSERMRIRGIHVSTPQALSHYFPISQLDTFLFQIMRAPIPTSLTESIRLNYEQLINRLEQNFNVFGTLNSLLNSYPLSPRPF